MKIKNIIKLSLIQTKIAVIKLKSALFLLTLMALIMALFVVWWKKSDMAKPTILIANEENSMLANLTVNSILNNKVAEIVNFVTIDYDKGKKQVDAGKALILVYIKKGTIETLYEGKRAEINLYTKNEDNDFTRLITSYIKGFTDIINVSQNAGLAYMDVMYERGMTEAERIEKFNELQTTYMKLTLARSGIFTGEDKVMGLDKKDIETGYYLLVAIFLIGISIGNFANSEILHKAKRQRLVLSGISNVEIYLTVIAKILLTNVIFLIIFINIAKTIGIGD